MKLFTRFTVGLLLMAVIVGALLAVLPLSMKDRSESGQAFAATVNPSSGSSGYFVMTFHFDSQLTATVADKAQWKMPWPAELVTIKCSGRAFGGSASPTYTWTLQEVAGTVATCAPTTAATEVEGAISDSSIADEASMTLDYASSGTSPTADDMTVILIFKRQ